VKQYFKFVECVFQIG